MKAITKVDNISDALRLVIYAAECDTVEDVLGAVDKVYYLIGSEEVAVEFKLLVERLRDD
jgi:rRNA processing protein Gar1